MPPPVKEKYWSFIFWENLTYTSPNNIGFSGKEAVNSIIGSTPDDKENSWAVLANVSLGVKNSKSKPATINCMATWVAPFGFFTCFVLKAWIVNFPTVRLTS